jgi:hypothetical protein
MTSRGISNCNSSHFGRYTKKATSYGKVLLDRMVCCGVDYKLV